MRYTIDFAISYTDVGEETYTTFEISLLVLVMFGSFLLILASFFILTITLIVVLRYKFTAWLSQKLISILRCNNL